jgi:ribonuclease BN (tRNA processing enzyme)
MTARQICPNNKTAGCGGSAGEGGYGRPVRLTVLGGCGAWPAAGQACSGYLVEQDGFQLLLDPGYATTPRLLDRVAADRVDAVLISHGHPDHCADLNPLLRARVLADRPPAPLPVYAPPGSLDPVLALDRPGMLDAGYRLHDLGAGAGVQIGPFTVDSWALPHHVPNVGVRLTTAGQVLAYTGDTGPSPDLVALAATADVFLAEATFADQVPAPNAPYLSSARQAGEYAAAAGARQLLLTHLWPGSDAAAAVAAARRSYPGPVRVAAAGLVVDLDSAAGIGP